MTVTLSVDALIAKYDRRIPRYTSYPTAPHFSDAVTGQTYAGWLAALPDAPLSLYIHVPFCKELCWYCGCNTAIINHHRPVTEYLDVLQQEIALVHAAAGRRLQVAHLHFGGGTPNILTADELTALMASLRQQFSFVADAEIAIELDPRTLTTAFIDAMAACGVTRVSLGVQDFNPEVQIAVNRRQPYLDTAEWVDRLRAAGINAINLDLMYGLPGQTREMIIDTVDKSLSLRPDRMALFGYAHVPWMKKHQTLIDESKLPDSNERWRLAAAASNRIAAAGYARIGLDHFAAPDDPLAQQAVSGTMRRNFQGYTTDEATSLIGLGPSSIGALPQGYLQNETRTPLWRAAVLEGRLPIARGLELSDDDRLRRAIIERLMCDLSVDLAALAAANGINPERFADALPAIDSMVADGLATRDGWRIQVLEEGRPLVRAACAAFDRYLDDGATRHAKAI